MRWAELSLTTLTACVLWAAMTTGCGRGELYRGRTSTTSGAGGSTTSGTGGTGLTTSSGTGGSTSSSSSSSSSGVGGVGGTTATGGVGGTTGTGGTGGAEPLCGNGLLDEGEACDDENPVSGDGCAGDCSAVEDGFVCPTPGDSCEILDCGDGLITGTETCDDLNDAAGDGCDQSCHVEPGWKCLHQGAACIAAKCGDGIIAGVEQCDDGQDPPLATDGCDEYCRLEPGGWSCPTAGQPCIPTDCGNQTIEGNEQCDDGDNDLGDGCTPLCALEPDCAGSSCTSVCGDGIWFDTEGCDDGNSNDGDGCSASCQVETQLGYTCEAPALTELVLPLVIRDFKAAGEPGGHPDFEAGVIALDLGIVQGALGADGKPVYAGQAGNPTTSGAAAFDQWYRDVAGVNLTLVQTLTLPKLSSGDVFQFQSSSFFPIDNQGFGNYGGFNHNFHFTSEVRYWFKYDAAATPAQLTFSGDDDVWVFVNKQLAVDIGGVHGATGGSVTFDAPTAQQLGLQNGSIHEIVVFQAERHTTQSNYQLTLANFNSTRSLCHGVCGDGILIPEEACDDGINDGGYNECGPNCAWDAYCGDELVNGPEQCDDGANVTGYVTVWPSDRCAPGCELPGYCGDGQTNALYGEQCDGEAGCLPGCQWQ